jgi:uncharacterized protein (UPF0332 family)
MIGRAVDHRGFFPLAIATKRPATKAHPGVILLFSDQRTETGRIPSSQMLVLTRLRSHRLASDYSYSFDVRPPDVEAELDAAERFVLQAGEIVAQGLPG